MRGASATASRPRFRTSFCSVPKVRFVSLRTPRASKDDGKGGFGGANTGGIGSGMIGIRLGSTSEEENHEEDIVNRQDA